MISPSEVSAVLVTKGDVDLRAILNSIGEAGIDDVVIWNNAQRENLSCFGRYAGITEARNEWIYHQDDDLIAPVGLILDHVDPHRDRWAIVANNRPDEEWPLTGMGVVFHRSLADGVFDAYTRRHGDGPDFHRICDVVFAYRNAYRRIWVGYRDLPWQIAPDRMHLQPGHMQSREQGRLQTLALPAEVPCPA